jgi:hypothetical protein
LPLLDEVIGRVLPLAVAGGVNGSVVVAETTAVVVETPPLVGLKGSEYVLATGVGDAYHVDVTAEHVFDAKHI